MKSAILFVFLFSFKAFAFEPNDSIPKFTVKWAPVALIDFDPNIQLHFEYFLSPKRSLEASYGFGNRRLLNWSDNDRMNQFRIQLRNYFRPFSPSKRGRGYWATELMYKNVLQPEIATSNTEPFKQGPYKINVNVAAAHVIIGHQFISKQSFPVFDIFLGLGLRGYNNINVDLKPGYSFQTFTMFNRLDGKGVNGSFVVGMALGVGK